MNRSLVTLLLAIFTGTTSLAPAQVRHSLTLPQSIILALKQGFSSSAVVAKYIAARRNAESSRRRQWTSVSLSLTAPNYSDALTRQFNPLTGTYDYYQLERTDMQSNLVITQPLMFTGGTLTFNQLLLGSRQTTGLGGSTSRIDDYFSDFNVQLQQPFLTPNLYAMNAKRAEIALAQAETDFLRDQLDLEYQVTDGFFSLYQLVQRLEIVSEQVRQNEESYQTAEHKFTGGLIPEVEVLQSEVDLAASRNDSLNTVGELARAQNAFRLLLGIATIDEIETAGDVSAGSIPIDLEKAVQSALEHRSEELGSTRNSELRKADIDQARSRSDFRFDLLAEYGANKSDTLFKNVFREFNRTRSASLTLSIPLFNWGTTRLAIEAAEVQYRNSVEQEGYVKQQIRQEIIDLVNRIHVAESRLQVLERSVVVAQKGYDITLQRFRNGIINRNDLALAQQRLTLAKTNSLSALIDYRLGLADLKRKTLWDFEKNEPVKPLLQPEED